MGKQAGCMLRALRRECAVQSAALRCVKPSAPNWLTSMHLPCLGLQG